RQQATFTGWDFTGTWAIDEGFSHPYLRWYGNPVPRVTTTSGTATFTESTQGDPVPVAVDPGLTVSDTDDITLASATVTIVANFQQGQDLLDFGNGSGMGNITGEYDADAGILALTSPGGT